MRSNAGEVCSKKYEMPTCSTCPYHQELMLNTSGCIRHAPVAKKEEEEVCGWPGVWPLVDDSDTCGEHPLMESYLRVLREEGLLKLKEIVENEAK